MITPSAIESAGVRAVVVLLFFLSGAFGLVYEVVWTRTMTNVFGTTAVAVGTVLAAFMSGLAAGSWLIGKAVDRSRNPLRLYALLEIGVAVAALIAHLLLSRIVTPLYLALHELLGGSTAILSLGRFVLAFGLVMAPTMLMGATLPVLARFFVRRVSAVGKGLGAVYAVNTFGALAGALAAGFVLIRVAGLNRTVYVAVLGNLTIGALAWVLSRRPDAAPATDAPAPEKKKRKRRSPPKETTAPSVYRLLLIGLGLSGLTSFAYEIYWMRSLVFFLGNSTYAVTTMLAAFLAGIALGGYLARFVVDRVQDRVALFGWIQILIGVSAAVALPAMFAVADPQGLRMFLGRYTDQVAFLILSRFAIAALVMLVPATLIGATFPLVGRVGVSDLKHSGSVVGRVYAVNTLGNVAGALLPGLVLLQWLGIQRGILTMALINVGIGLTALGLSARDRPKLRWAIPAAAVGTAVMLFQAPIDFQFPSEAQASFHRVLYYREGPSATTMVLTDPEMREKSMCVDGVDIGGNAFTEFKQLLLAHLPKILLDDVSPELSIGLGSGILAGESARHDRVQAITCVEIEPSVVAGAELFGEESHRVLQDPRVRVVVDDVANHLRTTPETYRVISADEKTSQEYASNGFSYSREYYELLRRRLAPGGIVVQWVPTTLPPSQYAMVLATFTRSMPHVWLWYFPPARQLSTYNTILVGSNDPIDLDFGAVRRRLELEPKAFESITRYGLTSAESWLAHVAVDGETIRARLEDTPENSFNRPRYEFYSPWDYAAPSPVRLAANLDLIIELRRTAEPALPSRMNPDDEDRDRLAGSLAAAGEFLVANRRSLGGAPLDELRLRLDSALTRAPWDDSLRANAALLFYEISTSYVNRQDFGTAADLLRSALAADGGNAVFHVHYSFLLIRLGQVGQALEQARLAVQLDPRLPAARRNFAGLLLQTGQTEEAAAQLRVLLELIPGDPAAIAQLARLG